MTKLLMITGDRALAQGKHGAFYNTLEELHKHFDRIDVICPNPGMRRYGMSVFGNVYVHPSPWPLVLQWLWIWYKGTGIVRQQHHEAMTVHEYSPVFNGVGARLVHRWTKVPYMLEVMHVTGLPRPGNLWERINRWLFKHVIAAEARPARAIRVINEHQVPDFLASVGVPRAKMVYVPAFYVDLDVFKPSDERKEYNLIFVGRLARNKGLDLFLDVVANTGLRGLIVGEGPLLERAKHRARHERLRVQFHGFAKDSAEVAMLINRGWLLVMPSWSEGGPRVVLEALACGVPVLATPVGIVPDVLPPEAIEEWSSAALADKARNILDDSELYDRLRSSGLEVVKKFERKAAIVAYAQAIKRLTV